MVGAQNYIPSTGIVELGLKSTLPQVSATRLMLRQKWLLHLKRQMISMGN